MNYEVEQILKNNFIDDDDKKIIRDYFKANYKKIELQKIKIEELQKDIINQDKHIDKLKNEYSKEIERLNNIINDLLDRINKAIEYNKEIRDLYEIGETIRCNANTNLIILEDKETLEILQELKNYTKESQNDAIKNNDEAIKRIDKALAYIKENAWYDYRDNEEVITIPKDKLLELLGSDTE